LADGAFAIVNLAGANIGEKRWTESRKRLLLDSRLDATAAVVAAIKEVSAKPKVLIQASGIGYYGDRGEEELEELAPPGSGYLADLGRRWEDAARPVEEWGVRLVWIRTSPVLSAHGGVASKLMTLYRFGLGGPLGSGRQWFPWIHLYDETAAIRFLLKNERQQGAFNLVAPELIRQKGFAQALGKALRRPAILPSPALALKLLLGEMAPELLLAGQKARPKRLLEAGYKFLFPDIDSALKEIVPQ